MIIEKNMAVARSLDKMSDFDLRKDVDKNLKHETEFIIKNNEYFFSLD